MYDVVAQFATDFSHRLCAGGSLYGGMEPVTLRLKALRESADPKVSVRKMAKLLGVPPSTYAAYEDSKKFKKPIIPYDLAQKIAVILLDHGVPSLEVMKLAGVTGDFSPGDNPPPKEVLWVEGAVAAGVWREQSEWPPEERYPLEVGPSPVKGAERFAVRMEGYSMDKIIPPGSDLECLRVAYGFVDPLPGDLVIVERIAHDLTEMTCKRLERDGDEWVLHAESTKPEFQEEIRLGKPDRDLHIDNGIRVIGIVIKAHQNHFRQR